MSAPPSAEWRCHHHQVTEHDVFISYRVATDADTAMRLADVLEKNHVTPFLDKRCLNAGESWQEGFENGLKSARVVILLISEGTLQGIRNAHTTPDNVLLEYQLALDRGKDVVIFPVLLATNGVPFNSFALTQFSEQSHAHPKSGTSVRDIMRRVFLLQGVHVDQVSTFCFSLDRFSG
jgi:hypothetical protein